MKKYIKIFLLGTSLLFQTLAFSQTEVTILMVYTDDARAAAGSVKNIETQIISAIDDGNLAMDNSNVNIKLSIAGMREVSVNENIYTGTRPLPTLLDDLTDPLDSVFDVVHQWRDEVGADIVYLIFEGIQSNGQANEICGFRVPCDESFEKEAFAVSQRAIMFVAPIVAHELGHVMGLFHDRTRDCNNPDITCNTGLFPYSYGHIDPQPPTEFGTIMAGGRPFPLINFFSNPNVNHPTTGQPLGVEDFSDAARHLNDVASIIGGFRVNDTGLGETPENPASSCSAILASRPDVSSGVYWLNGRSGNKTFEAYCDMTTDGGGWTLVVAQYDTDQVTDWNEGVQADYDPTLVSGAGFALNSDELPPHSQVAFGRDLSPTDIDYVDFEYTTQDIPLEQLTGLKTGSRYFIHRDSNAFYGSHNARPDRNTGSAQVWTDTLTFDIEPGLWTWAFSPNNPIVERRGFSYNGSPLRDTVEGFAWTVWVRGDNGPEIISPANGSRFENTRVTFEWEDIGADHYDILVGNRPGSSSRHSERTTDTSLEVINLPFDDEDVFVTIIATRDGHVFTSEFEYKAIDPNHGDLEANLISPHGQSITSSEVTFEWEDVGADSYNIAVEAGGVTQRFTTTSTSQLVSNIEIDGLIYVNIEAIHFESPFITEKEFNAP